MPSSASIHKIQITMRGGIPIPSVGSAPGRPASGVRIMSNNGIGGLITPRDSMTSHFHRAKDKVTNKDRAKQLLWGSLRHAGAEWEPIP